MKTYNKDPEAVSLLISTPGGHQLRITATPAQHGPIGGERGPVVGFVVSGIETDRRRSTCRAIPCGSTG